MLRPTPLILLAALAVGAAQPPPGGPGGMPECAAFQREGPPPEFAGGGPGPMGHGPEPDAQGPPLLRLLNLTVSQKQSIKGILDQHRPVRTALRRALAGRAMALDDALEDPSLPEAQLRALQAEESAARLRVALEDRAAFLEIHAVLSRDQQARAERLRLRHREERKARQAFLAEAESE